MKTGLNHAVRVTVAALSIVLGLGAALPAAAQCPGDIIPTGDVNGNDLAELLATWGTTGQGVVDTDLNDDGIVNGADLAVILSGWGPCAPVITSILPNTGSTSGGTLITITGNYFNGPATVTLGGVPATNVQVVSATTITALTPAAPAGSVDVVVTVGGHNVTAASGFTFRFSTVGAWGYNLYGQTDIPTNLGPCTAIAGGFYHTIALRTDGSVRAWGGNNYGQCNIPTDLGPCSAISGGVFHTIALRTDGTVGAWGYNLYGQTDIPTDLGPCTAIAGGLYHTIALRTDGTVKAWGALATNQGQFPNYGQSIVPTDLGPCTAVAGGRYHSIAIQR